MRSLLLIGLILLNTVLFSCGNKSEKDRNSGKSIKFSIEGKFENGNGRMLILQKIGSENLISLDTAIIDKKGRFSFRESTPITDLFILKTEKGQSISLLVHGREKIKITADYEKLLDYTVEGSEESVKIKELNQETSIVIEEINILNILMRDSVDSPNYAALRVTSYEKYVSLMEGLKKFSEKFIAENSESVVSLLALIGQVGPQMMVFDPMKDFPIFEKVDSSLSLNYPELPLVQNLHSYITVLKSQMAAQQQSSPGTMSEGTEVPDIALSSPEGKIIKLSSLRGKIVLLDFWASWCQPCRRENPTLVENYKKYNRKGFEIYQVSLDRTREDWLNGIKQDQLTWTHVSDLKYWESSVVPQFNIQGIPMNYLLDKNGKVIASNLRGTTLGEKLQELFKE